MVTKPEIRWSRDPSIECLESCNQNSFVFRVKNTGKLVPFYGGKRERREIQEKD